MYRNSDKLDNKEYAVKVIQVKSFKLIKMKQLRVFKCIKSLN